MGEASFSMNTPVASLRQGKRGAAGREAMSPFYGRSSSAAGKGGKDDGQRGCNDPRPTVLILLSFFNHVFPHLKIFLIRLLVFFFASFYITFSMKGMFIGTRTKFSHFVI
jgi:hypothetical protein